MEDIEKTRVSRRLGDCFSIDHNLEDDILAVSFDAGEMEHSCEVRLPKRAQRQLFYYLKSIFDQESIPPAKPEFGEISPKIALEPKPIPPKPKFVEISPTEVAKACAVFDQVYAAVGGVFKNPDFNERLRNHPAIIAVLAIAHQHYSDQLDLQMKAPENE